jgi:TPR repeat protein
VIIVIHMRSRVWRKESCQRGSFNARCPIRASCVRLVVFHGNSLIAEALSPCAKSTGRKSQRSEPLADAAKPDASGTASTNAWATVLDPQTPQAERQQALMKLQQATDNNDQHNLYLLGSLYWMGRRASGAPVDQDLDKASIYMGNAATHGSLLGMAKMAEIDLAMHKYHEAMIWAQVYGHYATSRPKSERAGEGYLAELVQRIIDKLGRSGVSDAMPDVASFIDAHDADIRAGDGNDLGEHANHPASKSKPYLTADHQFNPRSGIADYFLVFKPDGSVAHAWLLDAIPDPELGKALQKYAGDMTLPPIEAHAGQAPRYGWVPVGFDDGRYRISSSP